MLPSCQPLQDDIEVHDDDMAVGKFLINEMVFVKDTVVISQYRSSKLILCDSSTKQVIGNIDVTDLCSIYGNYLFVCKCQNDLIYIRTYT